MNNWVSWDDFKEELLKDEKVQLEVEALRPQYEIARAIIAARQTQGLSQAALARKVGTRQSAIARLESGNYNPSVEFLARVARALDADLCISLKPKG